MKTVTYADSRVVTYRYTGEGQVYSTTETGGSAPAVYLYSYDSLGRLISSGMKSPQGTMLLRTSQSYDANNRLLSQGWQLGADGYSESYTYNDTDGSLNTMTTGSGDTLTMGYDVLRRLASIDAGIYTAAYTYRDLSDTATTLQVAGLQYTGLADSLSFGYTYDEVGNLATYTETQGESSSTTTYTHDSQGQLTSATDGTTTHTYTYDTVGNILTASDGTAAHTYSYTNDQWQDLLTAFNGHPIAYQGQTYDAETGTVTGTPTSGNPVSYYNGTRWTFGWANGRQLVSADSTGTEVDFTYSADGLRMTKTVGSVTHTYYYAGGKLLRETYGDTALDFFYDANGNPFALKVNSTVHYYITNLQGDVLRLVDADGSTVAAYTYDPYGKVLTATGTLANTNPLRYRGYYYDTETGFYYLQSRYYDPTICRFINADDYASTGQGIIGHNMFTYCLNCPIILIDPSGSVAVFDDVAVAIFGSLCIVIVAVVTLPESQRAISDISVEINRLIATTGSRIIFYKSQTSKGKNNSQDKKVQRTTNLNKTGKPNSNSNLYNEDGSLKQSRHYDENGNAEFDIDYNHSGRQEFPHVHIWSNGHRIPFHIDYNVFFYLLVEFQ